MGLTLERWSELMTQFSLPECGQTYHSLVKVYTTPDRHYHNDTHITSCLRHFDEVRDQMRYPHEVELAIWFHDHVYAPVAKDNERQSADGAYHFLLGQEVDETVAGRVQPLILATDHQHAIKNRDMGFLVDIDLAILGSSREEYDAYEAAIAQEFRLIPEFVFHTRRGQFMRGLLARERLYHSDYFHGQYEERARDNITRTIENLTV